MAIADAILLKPDKFTPEEFEVMKTHTTIGANTLQSVSNEYANNLFIKMGIEIARSHHEKWDGNGYPQGLKGENIPLCARIMAVADVYDALRTTRPYKKKFTHQESVSIIKEGSGNHFDPSIIEVFLENQKQFDEISEHLKD